jgi:hypothetical protein
MVAGARWYRRLVNLKRAFVRLGDAPELENSALLSHIERVGKKLFRRGGK